MPPLKTRRSTLQWLAAWLVSYAMQRPYYHLAREDGTIYMERYWVLPMLLLRHCSRITNGQRVHYWDKRWEWLPSPRIHHTMASDKDRHLHDHPGWSCSWLLPLLGMINRYLEIMPRNQGQPAERDQMPGGQWRRMRRAGAVVFRRSTDRHRLEILPGESAWSLFIMGPSRRTWGFHTEHGWIPHFEYSSIHGMT